MSSVKSELTGNEGQKKTPRKAAAGTRKKATAGTAVTPAATEAVAPVRKAVAAADPEMVILDPTHQEIALRAYELYLARGRRDGFSDHDWMRAEQELLADRARARLALRQPVSRSTTES